MSPHIQTIDLPLIFNMGRVNCYLIDTGRGFILVDTGGSNQRRVLEQKLLDAGCHPGNLRLIVLTHGDFDHIGNAAYLRLRFETQIAMHPADAGMAEHGDMFANRQKSNAVVKVVAPVVSGFGKKDRFTPDIPLEDGSDLSEYGWEARVIHLPGHSLGSIGLLTPAGELLGGDLFENTRQPALNGIMDDLEAARDSAAKLASLGVQTVYPGHGQPFALDDYFSQNP
jgi:glyoxylase-like metal-dependent hydrolase (beta-lactamase superfamily II)